MPGGCGDGNHVTTENAENTENTENAPQGTLRYGT
jgi:hypothetical protein